MTIRNRGTRSSNRCDQFFGGGSHSFFKLSFAAHMHDQRNRSQHANRQQRPTSALPCIVTELIANQQPQAHAKSNASAADQHNFGIVKPLSFINTLL